MFSNAKVGDKVWDIRIGWGTIIDNHSKGNKDYPICVQFEATGANEYYTACGKYYSEDINPSLFWDEIKFDVPKKPLPKLEVDTKVIVWNNYNSTKYHRHFHSFNKNGVIVTWGNGKTSFTASKSDWSTWDNWELYEE